MMEFLRNKNIKKTRKQYRCFACGDTIEIGSPAVEWVSVGEGTVNTVRLHAECFELYSKHCTSCRNCAEDSEWWEGFMYESKHCGADCEPANTLRLKKEVAEAWRKEKKLH